MKLKKEYIIHRTEGESLLVPTGDASFHGIVQGNKSLGTVLTLLESDTTEPEIVAEMIKRYDAPEEVLRRDVSKVVAELREIGAIED